MYIIMYIYVIQFYLLNYSVYVQIQIIVIIRLNFTHTPTHSCCVGLIIVCNQRRVNAVRVKLPTQG